MPPEQIIHPQVEVLRPIQYLSKPFHSDRRNNSATFISNGRKVEMARSAHIPHFITDELASEMEIAENECHRENNTHVIGPTEVDGVPYPLVVVQKKGGAAKRVMNRNQQEYGVGVVTDAVFFIEDLDHKISFTAHKPKTKQEQQDLITLFRNASMKGNVRLSTMTGIYRFEYGPAGMELLPPELFMVQTHLGEIKHPLNIDTFINILSANGGKTAAGLNVPLALELLVKPQSFIKVDVLKYGDNMKVVDGKTVEVSGKNIDVLHLAGVGFID